MIRIAVDPFPAAETMRALWQSAWDDAGPASWQPVLQRSLAHIGAYEGENLVGFVNIAWDGGVHAFILDTCTHKDFRRQGIATRLVKAAEEVARERGAKWLHVDFEPHLSGFYRGCGFRPTEAGLIGL